MQKVEVTLPVPATLDVAHALAFAAGEFDRFRERGWEIEDEWLLTLGTPSRVGGLVSGRPGELCFRARLERPSLSVQEFAAFKDLWEERKRARPAVTWLPSVPAGAAILARVELREDGTVTIEGELTEGQEHVIRTALGDTSTHSSA